jgi:hypothetical protein
LSQSLPNGDIEDRSVAITFDDGYADNLHNARPLLERYGMPATFFLTSGYIGREREFWWDELERLILQPGTLPEVLDVSVNGSTYKWKLGKAAHYSSEEAAQRRRRWLRWRGRYDAYGSRRRLYYSLWELLYSLREGERDRLLEKLRAATRQAPSRFSEGRDTAEQSPTRGDRESFSDQFLIPTWQPIRRDSRYSPEDWIRSRLHRIRYCHCR